MELKAFFHPVATAQIQFLCSLVINLVDLFIKVQNPVCYPDISNLSG